MTIKKTLLPSNKLKPLYKDPLQLQFGRQFTDYMFTLEYKSRDGWQNPEIKPYQPLLLDPAANVLHYSQEVFEGQKAYKSPQGNILLFRPRDNARRINHSLHRLCMPELPEEIFLEAECELLKLEERWIPRVKGAALYIRPTVIGTEGALGVKPSSEFLFYIIFSPVGPYFQGGFKPISLCVSDEYTRAASGGTGDAKTGGNYACSLLAMEIAKKRGYDQVIWLDARERTHIEELSAMNIFFVINGKLVSPALDGCILSGITRRAILEMAPDLGITPEERRVTIAEVTAGMQSGSVSEVFAAGTAAVVTPVNKINYQNKDYVIAAPAGPWTRKIYDTLTAIQYGEIPDPYGWVYKVK